MEPNQLNRFFPSSRWVEDEIKIAIERVRIQTANLAEEINLLLPEGQTKIEMLMKLMHWRRDVELVLELDGPLREPASPITVVRQ